MAGGAEFRREDVITWNARRFQLIAHRCPPVEKPVIGPVRLSKIGHRWIRRGCFRLLQEPLAKIC
jgi:hypothetical protein